MRDLRIPLVVLLALAVMSWSVATGAFAAQSTALERGYRTGYSDGYSAGSRDIADQAPRDHRNKDDYSRGDRNYNEAWGTIEDYRDGYRQGFEAGYNAGYDRSTFDSSIPTGLKARGTTDPAPVGNTPANTNPPANTNQNAPQNTPSNPDNSGQPANIPSGGPLLIPRDAILLIELQSGLSSDDSQRGDRFQARVIDPREFEGATIDGRVTGVKRAGKVKGTAELQLSFDAIHMPDGHTAELKAIVIEVVDNGNRDDPGTADSEGGVKGRDSTKDDVTKVGAGAGIGAIIGAVIGGGKGAAIGAVIGGGVGAGTVLSQRGHDIRLARGQQLRIRTSTETQIQ